MIWRAAFADNTWTSYKSAWQRFLLFLKIYKFTTGTIQFNIPLFLEYVVWRFSTTGVAGATIRHDISGINAWLYQLGHGINLSNRNSRQLVVYYRGCDRLRIMYGVGTKKYYRRAMIDKMLDPMVLSIKGDSNWARTTRALLLFGKHTAFRPHNYVYTKTGGFCRIRHVRFYPSIFVATSMIITLPRTKTHQIDAKVPETRTINCRCPKPCAVHSLIDVIGDRILDGEQALFLDERGYSVSYYKLGKLMKTLCNAFNLDWHYYTPYCLRIGEATDRTMRGDPIEKTMKFVNWKSRKSAMVYIRPDNEDFVKFAD